MAMDADAAPLEDISLKESASMMAEEKEKVFGNNGNHTASFLLSTPQGGTSEEGRNKTPPKNKGQILFENNVNLKWVEWEGSIPRGAVYICNEKASRKDYVCVESGCSIGYFTESKGPYCYYPYEDQEHRTSNFKMLVYEGNAEDLEWKEGTYGSFPDNSVSCCPGHKVFVGRNVYGLGKVVPKFEAFFLPYNGKEKCYKEYEVLTVTCKR